MKKSKLLSVILSLVLVALLTACGSVTVTVEKNGYQLFRQLFIGEETTAEETTDGGSGGSGTPANNNGGGSGTPANNNGGGSGTDDGSKTTPDNGSGAADPSGNNGGDNTGDNGGDNGGTQPVSSKPTTKDEIIAYYVAAYNKIATDSKSVTRTYDYTSNYKNILRINNNSFLENLAKQLMTKFMVEDKSEVQGTAKDLPPVGVTRLTIPSNKISKAQIADKGSYYLIRLYSTGTDSNYEIDAQPGTGSVGLIGPLLRTEDVSGAAGSFISFEGLHAWYATANVVAKIDKATGHITDIEYMTPCILHFDRVDAKVIKMDNCDIGLLFHQLWKVNY